MFDGRNRDAADIPEDEDFLGSWCEALLVCYCQVSSPQFSSFQARCLRMSFSPSIINQHEDLSLFLSSLNPFGR